jgi:hypothetical protein
MVHFNNLVVYMYKYLKRRKLKVAQLGFAIKGCILTSANKSLLVCDTMHCGGGQFINLRASLIMSSIFSPYNLI